MDRLLLLLQDVSDPRLGGANSFSDRLSCRITVSILGVFALLITTRQYVGEPISCWCPTDFSNSNVDYTNKVCWTTSTYFLPFNDSKIPREDDPRRKIGYYQWVTVFLVLQSFMFYCPQLFWRSFNRKSGIALHVFVDTAIDRQKKTDRDSADNTMRYLVKQMGRFLLELSRDATNTTKKLKRFWLMIYGNYLVTLYLFVKILYITNVIIQIFLINAFLGVESAYHMYGFEVLRRLFNGENWTTSDRFPRVTICDFKILTVGNLNRRTVQCTLPLNLLYEIFYIFFWFWFMMVGVTTIMSFFHWLFILMSHKSQVKFIRNRLIAMGKDKTKAEVKIDKFVSDYLRRDGCFIVRLVGDNTSDHIAAELIAGLFEHYKENRRKIDKMLAELPPENSSCNNELKPVSHARDELRGSEGKLA